ncbi:low-density lipoprotein receptor-related protein 11 [Bufo gargarizans]|uniref:low-density lipoprotein receptor-related protein 11 n=1 Tax=Bufo gargarizans TaxID=30331 RepID=UPI001CF43DD2|nr:low-density lipoprotein receptor-related protein 11 [Bufo gargarizans]
MPCPQPQLPAISCLSLLTLLLCWDVGGCRRVSPGSPAPQLTDLRSQISGVEELLEEFRKQLQQGEDWPQDGHRHRLHGNGREEEEEEAAAMQQQLQEVAVRPSGDSGEDLCNFSRQEDYIIRTKDSLEAGATFLKAPGEVDSWKQCLEDCCSQPRCSAAVVESSGRGFSCFLFDCSHHGHNVCQFSPHRDYTSFTLTGRNASWASLRTVASSLDTDKLPNSNAGQDVVLQLPVDWVILDGRESSDDHAIIRYEWTLLQGDPLVEIKVPQPGTLRLSHLQEGVYTLQLTVTDTSGQKSSDNVSVSVLPEEHHKSAVTSCSGGCSRYQFICDDGCCIDITLACDRVVQCPDGSDEAFCQNLSSGRKTVIHISDKTHSHAMGSEMDKEKDSAVEKSRVTGQKTSVSSNAEKNRTLLEELNNDSMLKTGAITQHTTLDPRGNLEAVPGTVSSKTDKDAVQKNFLISKNIVKGNGHPAPEAGAVLPLALGLAITSLLLLMVVCRLQLVRQKLKKARPLTSEESDYLINGMYL